jgi:hypothetical protein
VVVKASTTLKQVIFVSGGVFGGAVGGVVRGAIRGVLEGQMELEVTRREVIKEVEVIRRWRR